MKPLDKGDPANQLRALRWALGQNFKALPGDELADLIAIPPIAIRAVESRRRKLGIDDRLNIRILLGAEWNEEHEQWVTTWDGEPYTREKFEEHQKMLDQFLPEGQHRRSGAQRGATGAQRKSDVDELRAEYHKRVDLFLDRLETPKKYLALTKLYRELRRIAAQGKVDLGGLE